MPVPDFSPGEVLTAQVMDSVAMWLVKTQTVGTTVSSVTVSDAFSADYENYLVTYSGGSCSANTHVSLHLGSTTSGYYSAISGNTWSNTASNGGGTSASNMTYAFSGFSATGVGGAVTILQPFLAKNTIMSAQFVAPFGAYSSHGLLLNTTSYTAFTIEPASGTLTGGTIRVYGYRN